MSFGRVYLLNKRNHIFTNLIQYVHAMRKLPYQGPVVQSIVNLTSSLVVKMLIVLISTISNSQVFC